MTNPLERRDWFVDAAAARAKAAGAVVSTEALQRQVASDLQLLDAVRRAGGLRESADKRKRTPEEVLADKRSVKAEAIASRVGGTVYRRRLPAVDRKRKGFRLTGVEAEKVRAMSIRLMAIGERSRRIRSGEDMEGAFAMPLLARRVAEVQFNHDAQRGEYAGKSARDRFRIYFAALQKVCDDSNAIFRVGWWVKK